MALDFWFLRDKHCLLIPGDSALGYRLPLESQPWAAPNDLPWIHPPDPNQEFPDLASHKQQEQQQNARLQAAPAKTETGAHSTGNAGVDTTTRPVRAGPAGAVDDDVAKTSETTRSAARAAADLRAYDRAFVTRPPSRRATHGRLSSSCRHRIARDYLDLSARSRTRAQIGPVILEGYEPPRIRADDLARHADPA